MAKFVEKACVYSQRFNFCLTYKREMWSSVYPWQAFPAYRNVTLAYSANS